MRVKFFSNVGYGSAVAGLTFAVWAFLTRSELSVTLALVSIAVELFAVVNFLALLCNREISREEEREEKEEAQREAVGQTYG